MSYTGETHYSDLPDETENYCLWTCTVCATSVNIFARTEHLLSRPHRLRLAGKEPKHREEWRCEICEVTVLEAKKEEHLMGWGHMLNVRAKGGEEGSKVEEAEGWDGAGYVGKGVRRRTFYCMTCKSEFPLDEQEEHAVGLVCQAVDEWVGDDRSSEEEETDEDGVGIEEEEVGEKGTTGELNFEEEKEGYAGVEQKDTHMMQQHRLKLPFSTQAPSGASTNFAVPSVNASAGTMFHCLPCKITMPLVGKPMHLASSTHCNNLPPPKFSAPGPPVPIQTTTPKNSTPLPAPTSSTKSGSVYKCVECRISMSINNMTSHLRGKKHQATLRLAEQADSSHYCAFCKVSVVGGIEAHSAGKKHRAAMQCAIPGFATPNPTPTVTQQPPPPPPPINPKAIFHCNICNRNFFVAQRDLHLKGIIHATAAATAKQEAERAGKGEEVRISPPVTVSPPVTAIPLKTSESDKFYCEVCGVFRKVVGRADHVKSKKHKKKAAEMRQRRAAQGAKKLVGKKEKVSIPVPVMANPPQALESDKFYCGVCNVFKYKVGKEDHAKSKKHMKKAIKLRKVQAAQEAKGLAERREEMSIPAPVTVDLSQAPESNQFYCEVCDVFKCVEGKAGHMGSKKHIKRFFEWERVNVGKVKAQVEF